MTNDINNFDATAVLAECHRDLEDARAVIIRLRGESDDYRTALSRVAVRLNSQVANIDRLERPA